MRIVLNGIETNNKGAELMLYAILQEIERMYPEADIYLPYTAYQKDMSYIQTCLKIHNISFFKIRLILMRLRLPEILRRLRLDGSFITNKYFLGKVDYFIDASGFAISDQWNLSVENVKSWKYLFREFGGGKCRMVFLPQAFGPIKNHNTLQVVKALSDSADIIMPREQVSQEWLVKSNVNKDKILMFTDFTSLVDGVFPKQYNHLKNGICIIPNCRMIDKGAIDMAEYFQILRAIIELSHKSNRPVYMLNHEGKDDENLAFKCAKEIQDIEVVTGLNALQVKGLIESAYLCVSSRFHGVASALNSCVPCLATSWSHKYAELFRDYGVSDCILPLDNIDSLLKRVEELMEEKTNLEMREHLSLVLPKIKEENKKMWEIVWNYKPLKMNER